MWSGESKQYFSGITCFPNVFHYFQESLVFPTYFKAFLGGGCQLQFPASVHFSLISGGWSRPAPMLKGREGGGPPRARAGPGPGPGPARSRGGPDPGKPRFSRFWRFPLRTTFPRTTLYVRQSNSRTQSGRVTLPQTTKRHPGLRSRMTASEGTAIVPQCQHSPSRST